MTKKLEEAAGEEYQAYGQMLRPPSLIISLLLLKDEGMHLNVITDYEIKKSLTYFEQMTKQISGDTEAYFGIAKLWFHMGYLEKASQMFERAIDSNENYADPVHYLWAAFSNLYLLRRTEGTSAKLPIAKIVQNYCLLSLEELDMSPELKLDFYFILIFLDLHFRESQRDFQMMPSKFLPDISAEDCAIEIKMIDPVYLGYISWGEIYLLKEEKKQLGVDVMVELISVHPENPEAYFSLWSSCLKDKNIEHF